MRASNFVLRIRTKGIEIMFSLRSLTWHGLLIVVATAVLFSVSAPTFAQAAPRSPSDTVREFYKAMREKRFREAFALSIYKSAIEPLKPQEFEDLRPDFDKMAAVIP